MKSNELNCGRLRGAAGAGEGGRLLRCVGSELEHVCGMCVCVPERESGRVAEKMRAIAVGGDGLLSSSSSFSFVMSLYFCT